MAKGLKNIKKEIEKRGFNISQFATMIERDRSTVSNWINGRREPSISDLCRLADIFNVSIDYLVGRVK